MVESCRATVGNTAGMGESVTYAELQFSKAPPRRSVTPEAQGEALQASGKADDTHETFQLCPVGNAPSEHGAQQHREPWWSIHPLTLALLAGCLALLATTITLGVFYWQQGQLLQQASHDHEAKEQRLGDVGTELEQAQAQLMWMQQEGNRSQAELQKITGELEHAQQLVQKLQQQLDRAQATVQSCQVTDCCLETWMLHRGKCLFLSKEEKTWDQSKRECKVKSSRLLVLQDWDHGTMPSFLAHTNIPYWIGLILIWDSKLHTDRWKWEDGTLDKSPGSRTRDGVFGTIRGGRIERGGWYSEKHRWVCERPAGRPQGTAGTDHRS
ncbi:oxidized low-density lipoprotein receptor 1 isoform X2 [Alligator mississippiensis]|uniref:oxidized low-density lipoprotein receptor 1 isoform X2 n=1 Tax=Alligator mississippiensis TaxID=8496 RepID=UPI0028773215|nr:oxidized low-density lipoprotein receptor 1 isoform X2 [Alligator mississippiensis]